jgi:hypothetical protein
MNILLSAFFAAEVISVDGVQRYAFTAILSELRGDSVSEDEALSIFESRRREDIILGAAWYRDITGALELFLTREQVETAVFHDRPELDDDEYRAESGKEDARASARVSIRLKIRAALDAGPITRSALLHKVQLVPIVDLDAALSSMIAARKIYAEQIRTGLRGSLTTVYGLVTK